MLDELITRLSERGPLKLGPAELQVQVKAMVDRLPIDGLEEIYFLCRQYIEGNRRASVRVPFFVKAGYTYEGGYQKDFVRGVESGGLFLETEANFQVGTEVTLFLQLTHMERPAVLSGIVVRKDTGGVGIEFRRPSDFILQFLPQPVQGIRRIRLKLLAGIKDTARSVLPQNVAAALKARWLDARWVGFPLLRRIYAGTARWCPVCESSVRRFLPYLDPPVPNARCPVCRSLERHRLDWLFLKKQTDLFDPRPKRLLHIAPERVFRWKFQSLRHIHYVTGDLVDPSVDTRLDITRLPFGDHVFDVIYCSHVLEHVEEDRLAMREFCRVLKPGRWAVIQVPITAKRTFENPAIQSPAERKRWFGQADHVRRYGPDMVERLRAAGFHTQVVPASDIVKAPGDFVRMGIQPDRFVFYCTKTTS